MKKITSLILILIMTFTISSFSTTQIAFANDKDTSSTKEEQVTDENVDAVFNKPIEMRAVNVVPGIDFFTSENMSQVDVKKEIDSVVKSLKDLTFNTVILDLNLKNKVIYSSDNINSVVFSDEYFDILDYFIKKIRENKMFIYTTFDVDTFVNENKDIVKADGIDEETINSTIKRLQDLVLKYEVDGIVLDNYYNISSKNMYVKYRNENSGASFENWLREWSKSAFNNIVLKMRDIKPNVQVGIYLDEVWVQNSVDPNGTPSNFAFSALNNGFSDTKKIIETTDLNFAILKTASTTSNKDSKFENVTNWWANIIASKGIPYYIQYTNSLIGSKETGWNKHDEIIRQAIAARSLPGFSGGSYESLSVLKENRFNSTTNLIKYYKNEVDPNLILKDFTLTSIDKNSIKTYEIEMGFIGAADPNFDLFLNDEKVEVQNNGAFSITKPLKVGENVFVFKHKGEEYKYNIQRSVDIFKDVTPKGTVRVEGNSTLEIIATAYKGAKVTAKINGRVINLKESDINSDDIQNNSYTTYMSRYDLPSAKNTDQNLGMIKFVGTFEGITQTENGGNIIINKKFVPPPPPPPTPPTPPTPPNPVPPNPPTPPINPPNPVPPNPPTPPVNPPNPVPPNPPTPPVTPPTYNPSPSDTYRAVVINKGGADGYDPNINTKYPAINAHRLPAGAIDFINSNKIVYNGVGYYILKSGTRVQESDITFIDNPKNGYNRINNITFTKENGRFNVIADLDWKSSIRVNYNGINYDLINNGMNGDFAINSIDIVFDNTNINPNINIPSNNIFSSGTFKQDGDKKILTLHLKKAGAFFGFNTYYNSNGDLVFSFNHINSSNSGNLNGVRVYVDPGHGGHDSGAGNPGAIHGQLIYEKNVTRQISGRLVNILRNKGATVAMTDNSQYVSLQERVRRSNNFNANIFISVHCNSSNNTSAYGTESFWYNPMSKRMSQIMLDKVSTATGLRARRSEFANYFVTRHQFFPAVLYETAFLSNQHELDQLIDPNFQQKIANALANAIAQYANSIY